MESTADDVATDARIAWGDLHAHCAVSYGRGTLERALAAAKEHLDFCSVTGHATWPDMPTDRGRYGEVIDYHERGFARLKRNWAEMQRTVEARNEPGRFVAFHSYEWHSIAYGDHNVYTPEAGLEIAEARDLDALERELSARSTMLIPHHIGYGPGARGIDWRHFDARRSPVVEMFSTHGSSESDGAPRPIYHTMGPRVHAGTIDRGLALGHRFGLIASTDHHGGYPGHYGGGRTAVFASRLSREAIWNALGERRCYAVTGDKIVLAFAVNDAPMGSEVSAPEKRRLAIRIRACDAIDRVDVIKNGRYLTRRFGPSSPHDPPDPGRYKVRLEWGWGEKGRPAVWKGRVRLSSGRVVDVERCFRGEEVLDPRDERSGASESELLHRLEEVDETSAAWHSTTFGNPHPTVAATSGLILELDAGLDARLEFEINDLHFSFTLGELVEGSKRVATAGWLSPVLQVHRAVAMRRWIQRIGLEDAPERGIDVYRVRVVQENGQMAWSSPIWATR